MLSVVADTNVYISALNFGGSADEVLALGRAGRIAIFVCLPIIEETEGVLLRKFGWSRGRVREASAVIRTFTRLVHPHVRLEVIKEDEPDNRVLECALEAEAHVVVTGDAHLRRLRQVQGMAILSPAEFLRSWPR